jgi:hypothetical protein
MEHRIRRLQWRVKTDRDDGFQLRQALRDHWQGQLMQGLQGELDAFAPTEAVVHIPRLRLHLRVKPGPGLLDDLAQSLRQQLREQLSKVAVRHDRVGTTTIEQTADQPDARRASSSSPLAYLLEYLISGRLPWPLAHGNSTAVAQRCRNIFARHRQAILTQAFATRQDEAFYYRLLQLLTAGSRQELLKHWLEDVPATRQALAHVILNESLANETGTLSHFSLILLSRLAVARQNTWTLPALQALADDQPTALQHAWQASIRHAFSSSALLSHSGEVETVRQVALEQARDLADSQSAAANELEKSVDTLEHARSVQQHYQNEEAARSTIQSEPEPYSVHAAGLVLLHPYLRRLFDNLGLSGEDKKSMRSEQLPRAAALLHYLASGSEDIHEFDLDLIKVMLGLHPRTVLLAGRGLLHDDDKQEADHLLQVVITHWQALKSTSMSGLRQAFLQRNGLLREGEFNYVLQVERTGHDILLDYLPWGYSLVKLPWMTKAVFTEW